MAAGATVAATSKQKVEKEGDGGEKGESIEEAVGGFVAAVVLLDELGD